MYLKRLAEAALREIISGDKVGIILGASQVGKTTLIKQVVLEAEDGLAQFRRGSGQGALPSGGGFAALRCSRFPRQPAGFGYRRGPAPTRGISDHQGLVRCPSAGKDSAARFFLAGPARPGGGGSHRPQPQADPAPLAVFRDPRSTGVGNPPRYRAINCSDILPRSCGLHCCNGWPSAPIPRLS